MWKGIKKLEHESQKIVPLVVIPFLSHLGLWKYVQSQVHTEAILCQAPSIKMPLPSQVFQAIRVWQPVVVTG